MQPDIKYIQLQTQSFFPAHGAALCKELWRLLLSAQENGKGVAQELLDAKKEELIKQEVRRAHTPPRSSSLLTFVVRRRKRNDDKIRWTSSTPSVKKNNLAVAPTTIAPLVADGLRVSAVVVIAMIVVVTVRTLAPRPEIQAMEGVAGTLLLADVPSIVTCQEAVAVAVVATVGMLLVSVATVGMIRVIVVAVGMLRVIAVDVGVLRASVVTAGVALVSAAVPVPVPLIDLGLRCVVASVTAPHLPIVLVSHHLDVVRAVRAGHHRVIAFLERSAGTLKFLISCQCVGPLLPYG